MPAVSLICTTYNNPEFLKHVLLSVSKQSFHDFELIIADDGSGIETKGLIDSFRESFPVPLIHAWQEDKGFRAAASRNNGIRESTGELLVFMDGDCVLHPRYVEDHYAVYKENRDKPYLFMGRKLDAGPKLSAAALRRKNVSDVLRAWSPWILWYCLTGDTRNYMRQFRIQNKLIRRICKSDNVKDMLSANCSIPRDVVYAINGFDETYVGYGGEDGDFFHRARNYGCKLIGLKSFGVQYHLYHARSSNSERQAAYRRALLGWDYKRAKNGLVKE
jgi:glycosyltransferase involved in cell wall biosynthesis